MPASAWRMLLVYFGVCVVLLILIVRGSAGFSYSLDDPYIHLALAQHILHGTYGVNAGETTSPASSVVWPFLLVPFADSAVRMWVPLLLNLVFGACCCVLLGGFLERWYLAKRPACGGFARWVLAVLFVLAANLAGLTLMGMEHTLQVLLTIGCAWAVMEAYAGRRIAGWALGMAALAPAVRYEDLAFTLSVVLLCWLQGRRRAAMVTGMASLLPLLALGLFLRAHGLSFLPNSVLVKGGVISARPHLFPHAPLLDHFLTIVAVNVRGYVLVPDRWPITVFALVLGWMVWRCRAEPVRRRALGSGLAGLVLIMLIGPYGYFFRYDVCYRLFAFLLVFGVLARERWFGAWYAQGAALLAAVVYVSAAVQTPLACWEIAHEQKQMHRFLEAYPRNVAVNDLGWVSFDASDRFYVLDLAGLASNEAARQRNKNAAWLDDITRRHHAGLVMLYRGWFPGIPEDWTEVAELHRGGGGPDVVSIYATPAGDATATRQALLRFSGELPSGSWLVFLQGRR